MHKTTKQYILPIAFGTLLFFLGFISILVYVDPFQASALVHSLFYLTILLWLTGLLTLIGLIIRKKFFPGIFITQLEISLRQGLLISALVTGLILLEVFNLMFWWITLTLILLILVIEFFFTSN